MMRPIGKSVCATLLAILTVVAFALPALASTVLELDLESLVANSDDIVIGKVAAVDARIESDGRVYSYIRIAISETIKGASQEELVLRQIGGRVDDLVTYVPGMPQFTAEEEVFLFIERLPRHDVPVVTGLAQGKFSIHLGPDAATRFVVPQATELRMVRPQSASAPLPRDLSLKDGLPEGATLREVQPNKLYSTAHELEDFKSQVRALVEDQLPEGNR